MAKHNCPELKNQRTKLTQMQNGSPRESRVRISMGILVSNLQGYKKNRSEKEKRLAWWEPIQLLP